MCHACGLCLTLVDCVLCLWTVSHAYGLCVTLVDCVSHLWIVSHACGLCLTLKDFVSSLWIVSHTCGSCLWKMLVMPRWKLCLMWICNVTLVPGNIIKVMFPPNEGNITCFDGPVNINADRMVLVEKCDWSDSSVFVTMHIYSLSAYCVPVCDKKVIKICKCCTIYKVCIVY